MLTFANLRIAFVSSSSGDGSDSLQIFRNLLCAGGGGLAGAGARGGEGAGEAGDGGPGEAGQCDDDDDDDV